MCTELMHVYMYVHVSLHWSFLNKTTNHKGQVVNQPHKIVAGICAVAPPIHSSNYPVILEQLWCSICLANHWSLELPCKALVCTDCTTQWFMA